MRWVVWGGFFAASACHPRAGAIGRCGVGYPGPAFGFTTSSADPTPAELAVAEVAFEEATRAFAHRDYPRAVERFLASAVAVRTVPDSYGQRDHVIANARTSYRAAAQAWAAMGRFEAEGRAVLEAASRTDPRMAEAIAEQLAAPPVDCPVGRWRQGRSPGP